MLTNSPGNNVRRFFVNETTRNIINDLSNEINRLLRSEEGKSSRMAIYVYVDMRVESLNYSDYQEFVDKHIIKSHLKDLVDILYSEIHSIRISHPFRMFHHSETLHVDK